jgi:hypothetical protein
MGFQAARRVLISFLLLFTFVVASPPVVDAGQQVHVKGYTKKDGTKVEPHDRKAPKSDSASSDEKKSKTKATKPPKVAKAPKHSTVSLASSGGARSNRCSNCDRDEHGKILRSDKAKKGFMRATGYAHGRPGYIIDHIRPLACGGLDIPSNMQWQTKAAAKAKDQTERAACR